MMGRVFVFSRAMMFLYWGLLCSLLWITSDCRLQEHRQFQYNSMIDGRGTYNFAYDTSHQPNDAHSLHMEYRDANGIVRGRYGYTDPRGILRVVEYEAGPDGFKARGDVGPDMFPHMEAPGLTPPKPVPAPTPLKMAGWDPETNPINEGTGTESSSYTAYSPLAKKVPRRGYVSYYDQKQIYSPQPSYTSVSETTNPDVEIIQQQIMNNDKKNEQKQAARGDVGPDVFPHMEAPGLTPPKPVPAPTPLKMAGWDPETNPINEGTRTESSSYTAYSTVAKKAPGRSYVRYYDQNQIYSRQPSYTSVSETTNPDVEIIQQQITNNDKKNKQYAQGQPLTIYNIDVDPDEIRVAGPPVSEGIRRTLITSSVPDSRRRNTEIIATSPQITYYGRSPRRRLYQTDRQTYSSPSESASYYSYGHRLQRPRQIRYIPKAHYHDQQYHWD